MEPLPPWTQWAAVRTRPGPIRAPEQEAPPACSTPMARLREECVDQQVPCLREFTAGTGCFLGVQCIHTRMDAATAF